MENPARDATRPDGAATPELGVCQWFHYEAYDDVTAAIELMHDLGLRHLRTGVSWADFHRPGGQAWYDWQMAALAEADLELLVSVWHTPPSIAEGGVCASPPRRLADYADFVGQLVREYGEGIEAVELWNEPNNLYKWDFRTFDRGWRKFSHMVALAAERAAEFGMPTVLGGMIPVDPDWLRLMDRQGALADVDAVAIHGFPGMWWEHAPNWDWYGHWQGWRQKIDSVADVAGARPVWITETGLATWDLDGDEPGRHALQVEMLNRASTAPAERVYWYSLVDLHPEREAIEGFHVDENEYHMGLVTHDGARKPAYHRMKALVRERGAPVPLTLGGGEKRR